MKKTILLILISFILQINYSEAQKIDSLLKKAHFELSFGQSLLFISNSKQINLRNESAVIVPTNSILFFVELRPTKIVRFPTFFNLPTETKQFLVNGQLINERASPTFGAGVEFRLFQIKIDERSKIDFEIGPLASFIFDKNNVVKVAPIVAGRIRIMRGENFVMYFGGSYSFGIDALGVLYGTGTIF
jgi:hypothetical protein